MYTCTFNIGNCIIGQIKTPVGEGFIYRYVICEKSNFEYKHFIGVQGFSFHDFGVFLDAKKYNVTEHTTEYRLNGYTMGCWPVYKNLVGKEYLNIFDFSERVLYDANDKIMSDCSNIEFTQTIPLSIALTIINDTKMLAKGKFEANEMIELINIIQENPECFGFNEENNLQKLFNNKLKRM